jgi:hypothetical protein
VSGGAGTVANTFRGECAKPERDVSPVEILALDWKGQKFSKTAEWGPTRIREDPSAAVRVAAASAVAPPHGPPLRVGGPLPGLAAKPITAWAPRRYKIEITVDATPSCFCKRGAASPDSETTHSIPDEP